MVPCENLYCFMNLRPTHDSFSSFSQKVRENPGLKSLHGTSVVSPSNLVFTYSDVLCNYRYDRLPVGLTTEDNKSHNHFHTNSKTISYNRIHM